jgi:hypothetical protein
MRYLIIDEFGTSFQTDTLTEEILNAASAGFITNLIDTKECKEYYTREVGWIDIREWEES